MKIFTLISIIVGAFVTLVGCEKPKNEPNQPAIKQFIEFETGGKVYNWTENDSITFTPIVGAITSNTLDSIFFDFNANALKAHKNNTGGIWYESINMRFAHKFSVSEAHNTSPNDCKQLSPQKFKELFSPSTWNCIGWVCYNQVRNKSFYMGLGIFVIDGKRISGSSAWDTICDEAPLDQQGSVFKINTMKEYVHPTYGKGLLLDGEFKLKIYTGLDTLSFNNGTFKFLVKACN